MPTGGKDIGKEDEIRFVLCAVGKGEAVEIGVGDAKILGLTALVGSHCNIAVCSSCEATEEESARALTDEV